MKFTQSIEEFAVVGISCKLPVIDSPISYYEKLFQKKNCYKESINYEFDPKFYHLFIPKGSPDHLKLTKFGFIKDTKYFDYKSFNISKKEAQKMDTQQQVLCETVLQALEDSNIEYINSHTGVYVGSMSNGFFEKSSSDISQSNEYSSTGLSISILSNRVSFLFGLTGPSQTIDTACSSSGYAMQNAINDLKVGNCEQAIVGGIQLFNGPNGSIIFGKINALSPTSTLRSFDHKADGFVRSEGCGVVILKPLKKAVRDKNKIYCVIKSCSSSANSSYKDSKSITTPSKYSQQLVLKKALKFAGVKPNDIYFWEAHATGTKVGDPIETNSFGEILGSGRKKENFLRIGSVKSNIGHTECSAFVSSLIKCCLMLQKGVLLPNINFEKGNPKIHWDKYNLKVQTEVEKFDPKNKKICISSFGFGGANICSIIEGFQQEEVKPIEKLQPPYLFLTFAKSKESMDNRIKQYERFSERIYDQAHLMHSLNTSKAQFHYHYINFRVGDNYNNPIFKSDILRNVSKEEREKICFIFSGQGSQYSSMGKTLFRTNETFRKYILRCDSIYKNLSGISLVEDYGIFTDKKEVKKDSMKDQEISIPAIVFIQISLFHYWKSLGIVPEVIIGHSLGEISAIYACGYCDLETILNILYQRLLVVKKIQKKGGMIAIGLGKEKVIEIINKNNLKDLYLAANNSSSSVTFAGEKESIKKLEKILNREDVFNRVLKIQNAFHTPFLEGVKKYALKVFNKSTKRMMKSPKIKLISTSCSSTSGFYKKKIEGKYFWENMRYEVKFTQAIQKCMKLLGKKILFLEISSHPVLGYSLKENKCVNILHSLNRKNEEQSNFFKNLGTLCSLGYSSSIKWEEITGYYTRLEKIPYYPFARKYCYVETDYDFRIQNKNRRPLLGKKLPCLSVKNWESLVNTKIYPFLNDHIVMGEVIFPAAGFLEIFLELFQTNSILDFEILNPINVPTKNSMIYLQTHELETISQICTQKDRKSDFQINAKCKKGLKIDYFEKKLINVKEFKKNHMEIMGKEMYKKFSDMDLMYGPSFKGILKLWKGDNECISIINTKLEPKKKGYIIQPSVIDCLFQTLLGCVDDYEDTYLPKSIKSFKIFKNNLPKFIHVHSKIKNMVNQVSIVGDICVFDEKSKKILIEIIDFQCDFLQKDNEDNDIKHFKYIWNRKVLPIPLQLEKKEIKEPFKKDFLKVMKQNPQIDGIIRDYCIKGLEKIDKKSSLLTKKRIKYFEWVERFIKRTENIKIDKNFKLENVNKFHYEAKLIKRVGENFQKIMYNENNDRTKIMFQDDCLDNFYHSSITLMGVLDYFTKYFENLLTEIYKSEKRVLRILELGSGTGAICKKILPILKKYDGFIEFFYTDISTGYFNTSREIFKDSPFIKFQKLDMDIDFSKQGIENNSIDIIIAYDVIHVSENIKIPVKNITNCLVPNGLLLLIEITGNPPAYMDFIFGSFEGWIPDSRESAYLHFENWEKILEGFSSKKIYQDDVNQIITATFKEKNEIDDHRFNPIIFDSHDPFQLLKFVKKNEKKKIDFLVVTQNEKYDPKYSEVKGIATCIQNEIQNWNTKIVDFGENFNFQNKEKWIEKIKNNPSLFENECRIINDQIYVKRIVKIDDIKTKEFNEKDYFYNIFNIDQKRNIQYKYSKKRKLLSGEVLIKNHSSSINFKDYIYFSKRIKFSGTKTRMQMVGDDSSGMIEKVAEDVKDLKPGDLVYGLTGNVFGSHTIANENLVCKVPKTITKKEAGTVPLVFITSYYSLIEKARIKKGDKVLIHSASGGVGQASIQICKDVGAIVLATVGSEEKRQYLRDRYGVKYFADSHSKHWDVEIRKFAPNGVDIVLNSLKGDNISKGMNLLSKEGRFIELGKVDIYSDTKIGMKLFLNNISFFSVHIDLITNPKIIKKCMEYITQKFKTGKFKPFVEKAFKLHNIEGALNYLKQGIHMGKIAIEIENDNVKPSKILPPDVDIFSSNKTYILSGGLGGIGFKLCERMIEKYNVNYIVLLSRSGKLKKEQDFKLKKFKRMNKNVFISVTDVTNKKSVENMYKKIKELNYPTIGGIFHLALVLNDMKMTDMKKENYEKVVCPKKIGGLNLVNCLLDQSYFNKESLEFIFFFSSVSNVFGNIGQANYVAGNNFLESFARNLRKRSFPAYWINLGAVADVGALLNMENVKTNFLKLVANLNIKNVLQSVEEMLLLKDEVQYISKSDFTFYKKNLQNSHLEKKKKRRNCVKKSKKITRNNFAKMVKDLLMIDEDINDFNEKLTNFGIDSLQSIELSRSLKDDYNLSISQMKILGGITINDIYKIYQQNNINQDENNDENINEEDIVIINESFESESDIEKESNDDIFMNNQKDINMKQYEDKNVKLVEEEKIQNNVKKKEKFNKQDINKKINVKKKESRQFERKKMFVEESNINSKNITNLKDLIQIQIKKELKNTPFDDYDNFKKSEIFQIKGIFKSRTLKVKIKNELHTLIDFGACSYMDTGELLEAKKLVLETYKEYGANSHASILYEPELVKEVLKNLSKIFKTKNVRLVINSVSGSMDVIPGYCQMYNNNVIILVDTLAHNTLSRAIKLCDKSVPVLKTKHMEYSFIEKMCKENPDKVIIYVNDGVFSMEGPNGCYIDAVKIYNLCEKYSNLEVYIDDAHGFGWTGKRGEGWFLSKLPRLHPQITVLCSFRKAVSGSGAILIFGDSMKMNYLENKMFSKIFQTGHNPQSYALQLAQTRFLLSKEYIKKRDYLKELIEYRNKLIKELKLETLWGHENPTPLSTLKIPVKGRNIIEYFQRLFYVEKYFVLILMFPAIPRGKFGMRITTRCCHTKKDVKKFLYCVKKLNDEFEGEKELKNEPNI